MFINLNLRNAREERPEKSCEVLYFKTDKQGNLVSCTDLFYSKEHDAFNAVDFIRPEHAFIENFEEYEIYWCYVSELEKEIGGNLNESNTLEETN
jgi:hypothetical protein